MTQTDVMVATPTPCTDTARVGAFLYDDGVGVGELDGAFVIGSWRPAGPLPWVHVMETTTLPAFARPFSTYSMA